MPVTGVPEDGVENRSTGIFKEIMAKNLPKLMKNNKTPTQAAQRTKTLNKAFTFSLNKLKEQPYH